VATGPSRLPASASGSTALPPEQEIARIATIVIDRMIAVRTNS
jgi:hypothetical protein